MKIISPMSTGNGAFIVHRYLQQALNGYSLIPFDPRLAMVPRLLRFLKLPPSDILHTVPDYAPYLRRRSARLVVTFHNYVLDAAMRPYNSPLQDVYYRMFMRPCTRRAVEEASAVTCVSDSTAELLRGDLGWDGPVHVIRNGVDTERFRPRRGGRSINGNSLNVLFSGNLTRRKGAHLLPAIAAATADNVHIWYTGGLRTRSALPSHPRLHALGNVHYRDMPEVYQRADLLLVPTVREGLSLAVAEAMACGLPVVASNVSSLPEMIVEGKGGCLCAPGDAVGFAMAINTLATNPDRRHEMGAFNRARAEKCFDHRRMVAEYRDLFEAVAA